VIRPTAWDLLERALPNHGPVGAYLDSAKTDVSIPSFAAFWSALSQLSGFSAAALDAAVREVFDLASYRLDAWITSLAYLRLESLRTANPNGGIVLGSYGWLEDVRPQPQQAASSGFVHAPSLNQATTAAVLRAGFLAHSDASPRPFEIDLSSERFGLRRTFWMGFAKASRLARCSAIVWSARCTTWASTHSSTLCEPLRRWRGELPISTWWTASCCCRNSTPTRVSGMHPVSLPRARPNESRLLGAISRLDDALGFGGRSHPDREWFIN